MLVLAAIPETKSVYQVSRPSMTRNDVSHRFPTCFLRRPTHSLEAGSLEPEQKLAMLHNKQVLNGAALPENSIAIPINIPSNELKKEITYMAQTWSNSCTKAANCWIGSSPPKYK
jgi:hypothetical protein